MWWNALWDARCVVCAERGGYLCPRCHRAATSQPVETTIDGVRVVALGWYSGELRTIIRAAKNYRTRAVIRALGSDLPALVGFAGTTVVPVPPSRPGMVRRGYGLGMDIARLLPLPIAPVLTLADAGTQRGRSARDRSVNRGITARPVGSTVVLVDDVMTTGATLRAAIRALECAGSTVVLAVVLAIVPHH